jgi:hypothetical protein
MTRRLVGVLGVLAAAFVVAARAEQPLPVKVEVKNKGTAPRVEEGNPQVRIEDLGNEQERLKAQFQNFRAALITLADRLANSPRQEDRDRAANLKKAIKTAAEEGVEAKFSTLIDALRKENAVKDLDQLQMVLDQNADLRRDLRLIMEMLLKDNRDAELRKEIEKNARLLEEINRLIAKQEKLIAKTYGRTNTKDVLEGQKQVTRETRNVAEGKSNKGDQDGETKKGEGKGSKSGKEGLGEPKEDTRGPKGESREGKEGKEGKQGEGKDGKGAAGKEGKAGEGKEGEGKDGKGGEGKEGKAGEGKDGKGGDGKEGKPGDGKEGKSGEGKEGKPGEGKEGKPGNGKEGKPGEGKPGNGKPADSKPGQGKPGEGKTGDRKARGDGKGEARGGKPGDSKSGSGKPGESKGSQSGQSGQQGQAKQGGQQGGQQGGKQAGQQPPQDNPVKKQVQDANKYQEKAEKDLENEKRADAGKNEEEARDKLEQARKKLEDLLKQLREEEIERLLAALQARCQHMLTMQIAVRDGTVDLDKAIQAYADKKATRADEQASLGLADKEDEIVKEAAAAIRIIEAEGSAVAFAEVFKQVYSDMVTVHARLRKTDVGTVTITIENDIIATLKEMIEALKKARQENQAKQGKPSQGGGMPQDQKLIDLIAELKMIRSMQLRVNARTQVYGKQYEGEQAPPPMAAKDDKQREHYEMIQRELKDLGGRQEKISKVTHDIATGKNENR